jgi:hypothetical protein
MTDPNEFYRGGIAVRTYDLFITTAATEGDTQFYCECARRFGGDVLELGVGTARVAIGPRRGTASPVLICRRRCWNTPGRRWPTCRRRSPGA